MDELSWLRPAMREVGQRRLGELTEADVAAFESRLEAALDLITATEAKARPGGQEAGQEGCGDSSLRPHRRLAVMRDARRATRVREEAFAALRGRALFESRRPSAWEGGRAGEGSSSSEESGEEHEEENKQPASLPGGVQQQQGENGEASSAEAAAPSAAGVGGVAPAAGGNGEGQQRRRNTPARRRKHPHREVWRLAIARLLRRCAEDAEVDAADRATKAVRAAVECRGGGPSPAAAAAHGGGAARRSRQRTDGAPAAAVSSGATTAGAASAAAAAAAALPPAGAMESDKLRYAAVMCVAKWAQITQAVKEAHEEVTSAEAALEEARDQAGTAAAFAA